MAREHTVKVQLSEDELEHLDELRGGVPRTMANDEGGLRQLLDDLLRLAPLLNEPEIRVLLDHQFYTGVEVPRRDRELVISRAGLLPLLRGKFEP